MNETIEFHSIEQVHSFVKDEVQRDIEIENRKVRAWQTAKYAALLILLLGAYLQYYFLGVMQECMQLQTLQVNVPVKQNPALRANT